MTESDRAALKRLLGSEGSRGATTDDLQGLLLQVVFALLMVFMIAYFIFVETSRKERAEEIIEVNRQKLILAIDKVAEDHRVKYGLNALMTQGTDGRRSFDADEHVKGGRIELAPAAKAAFASGSAAAFSDYRDTAALAAAWKSAVLEEAKLEEAALTDDEKAWLGDEVARVFRLGRALLGAQHVSERESPSMGGEDFSYFCAAAPGAFWHLGCAPSQPAPPLHSRNFVPDERCLPIGAAIQSALVLDRMGMLD